MSRFVCEAVDQQHRTCRKCFVLKSMDEFYAQNAKRSGRSYYCKGCMVASVGSHNRTRRKTERGQAQERRWGRVALLRSYGLTEFEFSVMWEGQEGRCQICREPLVTGTGGAAIDHCHSTGRVRGILCMCCNTALGKFRDNPSILRAAAAYLEVHQSPQELTVDTPAAGHA